MVILEQTSDCLRIGYRWRPWRRWVFFALALGTLVCFGYLALNVSGPGSLLLCGTTLVLPSALLVAYLGLVRVSEAWQFDRVSGDLTIVRRALLLRSQLLLRYPLTDIVRVSWQEKPVSGRGGEQPTEADTAYALRLHMRSGETVKLDSWYDLCRNGPSIAQAISTFLGIPEDAKKGLLWEWF